MVYKVIINKTPIPVTTFDVTMEKGFKKISFKFEVTHERYHEITTLLYQGTFHVEVPEKYLSFKASIQNYSTSINNLYKVGEVGEFYLSLLEVKS